MSNWETFKLSELKLDQKNYRTGPQKDQRAALRAIIEDQEHRIVNLARDLLSEGPSPGEPIWVTREHGSYFVLEGNRRVAALKLLENPALAVGTVVEDEFQALGPEFSKNPRRELEALVFDNRKEAQRWIRRRHMTAESGVGLQRWSLMAKGRANREHGIGAPRSLAVVELLQDDTDEWAEIEAALDTRWSTVDRVLNAKALREELGVTIDAMKGSFTFENGDARAGKKLLREILATMASSNFNFALVEKVGDRTKFLQQFLPSAVKAKRNGGKGGAGGKYKAGATGKPTKTARAKPDQSERATLAPKAGSRSFQVDGVRLQAIYRECRNLKVQSNENAAALLLRVFIELSTDEYLITKKVPIPAEITKRGKTAWDDFGISLDAKIAAVADHLDPTGKAKAFEQARLSLDRKSKSASSITTLHGYMHNRLLKPDAILPKEAWDAWETYLTTLHAAL